MLDNIILFTANNFPFYFRIIDDLATNYIFLSMKEITSDNQRGEMMKITTDEFKTLNKASEGISRVTDLMSDLVYRIAYEIADLGSPGDSVTIGDLTLSIVTIHTSFNGGCYNYLKGPQRGNSICLFDIKCKKFGSEYKPDDGYLEDPEPYEEPTRGQQKWFLQHVAEIIQGFTILWHEEEERIDSLLEAAKAIIIDISSGIVAKWRLEGKSSNQSIVGFSRGKK
ncbi:hypothetical protein ES703_77378 [subsurface metagenome]